MEISNSEGNIDNIANTDKLNLSNIVNITLKDFILILPKYEILKLHLTNTSGDISNIISNHYNKKISLVERDIDGLNIYFGDEDDYSCEL